MNHGHSCPRCGQVFPRSENLRRHLARKNPCIDSNKIRQLAMNTHHPISPINSNDTQQITISSTSNSISISDDIINQTDISNIRSDTIDNDVVIDAIHTYKGNQCPFCGKKFSTITNRNKHTRYTCRAFFDIRIRSTIKNAIISKLNTVIDKLLCQDSKDDSYDKVIYLIQQEIDNMKYGF